jgi:hypothetical protein
MHILVKYFKLLHVVSLSWSLYLLLGVHGTIPPALGLLCPACLEAASIPPLMASVSVLVLWGFVTPSPSRCDSNVARGLVLISYLLLVRGLLLLLCLIVGTKLAVLNSLIPHNLPEE